MLVDVDATARTAFDRPVRRLRDRRRPGRHQPRPAAGRPRLVVALMEAGGLEWSEQSQAITAGTSVGLRFPDLDTARLRYLGGSSGHWNGLCRALEAEDFAARPENPRRRLADRQGRPRPLCRRGARDPRPRADRRRGGRRHRRRPRLPAHPTISAAPRPASARSTSRSSPPRRASPSRSTPTSSTCAWTTPATASPARCSRATPRAIRLHRHRRRLLPLLRRHRERPAAPELHQPGAGGHRQPERPGRALLQRPSRHAAAARRGDLHRRPGGGGAVLRADRGRPSPSTAPCRG